MMQIAACDQLCALLAQAGNGADSTEGTGKNPQQPEQRIIEHIASCSICQAEDAELAALIARYCGTQPRALGSDLETRLLDTVCSRLHR